MKTFTPSDAPGRLERSMSWRAIKSAVLHTLPGILAGAMPVLAVSLELRTADVAALCATALALSYGFWRYQRWEAAKIEDWSFIQWGEYVTGAFIGAAVTLVLLVALHFF